MHEVCAEFQPVSPPGGVGGGENASFKKWVFRGTGAHLGGGGFGVVWWWVVVVGFPGGGVSENPVGGFGGLRWVVLGEPILG